MGAIGKTEATIYDVLVGCLVALESRRTYEENCNNRRQRILNEV